MLHIRPHLLWETQWPSVYALDSGSRALGSIPLSTQEEKWVPANCQYWCNIQTHTYISLVPTNWFFFFFFENNKLKKGSTETISSLNKPRKKEHSELDASWRYSFIYKPACSLKVPFIIAKSFNCFFFNSSSPSS